MKPRVLALCAFLAVTLAAALVLRPHDQPPAVSARPVPPPLSPAITPAAPLASQAEAPLALNGVVVPERRATLSARMPARIAALYAAPNQPVSSGALLIQLDDSEIRAQIATAHAGVTAAEAQLEKAMVARTAQQTKADADLQAAASGLEQAQVKARQAAIGRDAAADTDRADLVAARQGVVKAEAGVQTARETVKQLEAMGRVGGVSRSDLEGARTQATLAQADLDTARAQLSRLQGSPSGSAGASFRVAAAQQDLQAALAGVRQARDGLTAARQAKTQIAALAGQDINGARAALAQARSAENAARSSEAMTRLLSPISGVISTVSARVGETAQPGMPLIDIVSVGEPHVDALVPARAIAMLRVGQAAWIAVDTRPGRPARARVSEISPVAEPDGRTFRVTFRLAEPAGLRPGQAALITLQNR